MNVSPDMLYPEAVGFCSAARSRNVAVVPRWSRLSPLFQVSLPVGVCPKCASVFEVSCYKLPEVKRLTLLSCRIGEV